MEGSDDHACPGVPFRRSAKAGNQVNQRIHLFDDVPGNVSKDTEAGLLHGTP